MKPFVVCAKNIEKIYKLPAEEIHALDGVDLEIPESEFVSIMGPSGSGKTTLLDLLGCLDAISSGTLEIAGVDISKADDGKLTRLRREALGFVFQSSLLIPTLNAMENVELACVFARKGKDPAKAKALLEKVGLGHRLKHLPRQLSGGEMQRVAIARALVTSPKILLADEPTGNLDTKNSKAIFGLFKELGKEGLTIIMATHNEELGGQADRLIHLQDGKIVEDKQKSSEQGGVK